jgi:flagellar hook-associated protein 3 FlgL
LIQSAVQLSNSRNQGGYLLGGTRSDQVPFVATKNADGQVTAVSYQGNTSLAESEISQGTTLTALTLGANTSNVGPLGLISDNRVGADFFNHLISLQNNLLAGNTSAINNSDRPELALDEENILSHVANSGAVMARLETSSTLASNRNASLQTLVSKEADADLAETLVRLKATQTAYQAALQRGATILNLSLMDYLK